MKVAMSQKVEADEGQPTVVFKIDPDIDISLKALKDMVLTNPTSMQPLPPPPAATTETSNAAPDWDW